MQISLKWVNELVDIDTVNLDDLINKLTLGGFEVEEILEIDINNEKTITLDISATANRSDSLSIQGLTLEIAALLNQAPKIEDYSTKTFSWSNQIETLSQDSLINSYCSGFISLTIENLENIIPPTWLKQKLIASGIIPENNLIDFQNYILLETGYPFEFYDLDKISSKLKSSKFNLTLTAEHNLSEFKASNGVNYNVDDSILILKANDLPISIAGIISNNDVSYSTNTSSLLIEGSIFNAAKIRQQSRKLGVRTDRSSRYEKALKNSNLLESFYRLISLLRIENPNLVCKLHTIAKSQNEDIHTIRLNYDTIKKVLGPIKSNCNIDNSIEMDQYISPLIITQLLERLQFKVNYDEKSQVWDVRIPTLRMDDIVLEIDLIEEIGRLYGFNNFLTRLPQIQRIGIEDLHYQTRKKLTSCFINLGLNELIQYSLVSNKTYLENEINLVNPLGTEYSHLRSSLLPNLVTAVANNSKNGNSNLEGFEYGHIFSGNLSKIIKEEEYVAGIFGGITTKSSWASSSQSLNWFEAKGRIEGLFKKLNLPIYWKVYSPITEKEILHPYCTAEVYLTTGVKVGIFGQIHPILAKKLVVSSHLYLFEFNFNTIHNQIYQNKLPFYQEYSTYPKVIKDLSFIIKEDTSFEQLKDILYLNGTKFLTEIKLLDEYRGNSIPDKHISLCLQFIFQAQDKTLQTRQIETIIQKLEGVLTTEFGVILRA